MSHRLADGRIPSHQIILASCLFLPFHPGPPRPLSFSLSLFAASPILCCSFPNGGECHWLVLWLFNLSSLLGPPYCSLLFIIIRNCFALPAIHLPFLPLFSVYHLSPPSSAQVQTYCERCVVVYPSCPPYPSLFGLRCAVWLRAYDCHCCAIPLLQHPTADTRPALEYAVTSKLTIIWAGLSQASRPLPFLEDLLPRFRVEDLLHSRAHIRSPVTRIGQRLPPNFEWYSEEERIYTRLEIYSPPANCLNAHETKLQPQSPRILSLSHTEEFRNR